MFSEHRELENSLATQADCLTGKVIGWFIPAVDNNCTLPLMPGAGATHPIKGRATEYRSVERVDAAERE
jgi:hypothetical protein